MGWQERCRAGPRRRSKRKSENAGHRHICSWIWDTGTSMLQVERPNYVSSGRISIYYAARLLPRSL